MDRIQVRRGTTAEWTAANPVLAQGEPGLDVDTREVKYGDGVTAWQGLEAQGVGASDVSYDPSTSGLAATNAQAAIDEVAAGSGSSGAWEALGRAELADATSASVSFTEPTAGAWDDVHAFRISGLHVKGTGTGIVRVASMTFNGDIGSNYRWLQASENTNGSGTVAVANAAVEPTTNIRLARLSTADSTRTSTFQALVDNRAGSGKEVTCRYSSGGAATAITDAGLFSGGWSSTSRIESISLTINSSTFATGGLFILEGLR